MKLPFASVYFWSNAGCWDYHSRRGCKMPTYLSLLRFTKQGVEKIKDSPSRVDAGKKAFEAAGGKIIGIYGLLGQYDLAILAEAPDDLGIARLSLRLASQGNVRMETMRAFTEDEYRKIVSGIS
jgi:uncharacterized protein with GYD domain